MKDINFTPSIPKKLSKEFQEVIKILLNPSLTNDINNSIDKNKANVKSLKKL